VIQRRPNLQVNIILRATGIWHNANQRQYNVQIQTLRQKSQDMLGT